MTIITEKRKLFMWMFGAQRLGNWLLFNRNSLVTFKNVQGVHYGRAGFTEVAVTFCAEARCLCFATTIAVATSHGK